MKIESSPQLARFRRLAVASAVATLALTSVGALVRATGSGLGCLDSWPRCAGRWIAPLQYHTLIELSHRVAAVAVVVLIAAMVVAARTWLRGDRTFTRWSLAALGVVIAQALVGALVVRTELHAALVTVHYLTALALVGVTSGVAAATYVTGRERAMGAGHRVARMSAGALVALLPVLVLGAYVREKGAGLAFGDWPLMEHKIIPSFHTPGAGLQFAHRLLALLVFGHLVTLALRAREDARPGVRFFGQLGVVLYVGQALLGAANVKTRLAPGAVLGHASLSFCIWAAYVVLAVIAARTRPHVLPPPGTASAVRDRIVAYVALTKPRIILLLLITTVPAMVLAERGLPSLWLVAATLAGGMMTAGSANALNQFLERDIDAMMERTRSRPLPRHSVEPMPALAFAIVLGIAGFLWLAIVVNLLSAALAAGAIVFYVGVYTLLLKRSTSQNIVIGGAAGAVPVLVGWAAVTGTLSAAAWVMFAIIFLWTPPHFWALAMRYRDDYARAGVPMLPVVKGSRRTATESLVYATVLVAATLVLWPVGRLGPLYVVCAAVLGAGFLYRAVRLRVEPDGAAAMKMFRYSITYLALLFGAIAVAGLVR
jgi:protoheme IX farnesyltransferase